MTAPSPDQRAQAGQLASDADQAVILGELLRAEELLERATELDAASAELAYRRARVLEDLERSPDAMAEYCRSLGLGAEDQGIADVRTRLDGLYEVIRSRIPEAAREAFVAGVASADSETYESALDFFTDAMVAFPDWPPPIYNRAVVYERMGLITESLADYRRYLELTPSDIDPIVAAVTQRVGMLEGMVAQPTASPSGALALGVAFPGMGQYYSGRSRTGTVVLGTAVGAVAAGILFKKITVRCYVTVGSGEACPADQIVDETSSRPYLGPAIGAAAAITVAAAIEAFVRARQRRADATASVRVASRGPSLVGPSISARGTRVDVSALTLRFR